MNEAIEKQLYALFPKQSQKTISACLKYFQKEIGNGDNVLLFRRCIDYLTDLTASIKRLNLNSSSDSDSSDCEIKDTTPIVKFEDEINSDVENADGNRDENNQRIEINVAALKVELEVERNIENILNVFPDVQREWVEQKLRDGHSADLIVDFIVTNPTEAPRIVKVSKENKLPVKHLTRKRITSSKKDEPTAFYILHNGPVSREYEKAAINFLYDDFFQIAKRSIMDVFTFFNHRYAPTFLALNETLTNNSQQKIKVSYSVPLIVNEIHLEMVEKLKNKPISIKIIINKRKNDSKIYDHRLQTAPRELIDEIKWSKENLRKNKSRISNVFTPRRAARRRAEAEFECMICCDIYLITEMVSCTDGHLFCPECLRNYAKEVVYGQAQVLLTCLNVECKCGFTRETLETVLDEKCIEKLDERLQSEEINSAGIENLIRCKFCNFAAIVDVPVEQNKVFKCQNPDCEKEFCRICNADWEEHVGLPCKEFETSDETKLRKEMEEKMVDAVARECQKCKSKIIKETGCNKMTCRCGAKMCYVCRQPDIDYDHFCRHLRSPGKSCSTCKACSLWEDTTKTIDAANLEKVKQEAQEGQKALGRNLDKVIGVDETKFAPAVVQSAPVAAAVPVFFQRAPNFVAAFDVAQRMRIPAVAQHLPIPAAGPQIVPQQINLAQAQQADRVVHVQQGNVRNDFVPPRHVGQLHNGYEAHANNGRGDHMGPFYANLYRAWNPPAAPYQPPAVPNYYNPPAHQNYNGPAYQNYHRPARHFRGRGAGYGNRSPPRAGYYQVPHYRDQHQ